MKITINKNTYDAKEGQTVLEVARENGIYIPSLCYNDARLGTLSTCRACVVEIEGIPGLQTACATLASEGMAITTNSRRVIEAQKLMVEFLLSAGIHNCAVCPRYENCKLKEAAHYLGIELDMTGPVLTSPLVSWFEAPFWNEAHGLKIGDPKRSHLDINFHIDDSDEFIQVVRDRCILCGLCVESCHTAGRDVIHFAFRGHQTRIIFDNNAPLGKSRCDHCGECLSVCPTGALTQKKPIPKEVSS